MHVLLVEDHQELREALGRCLASHGYDVTTAANMRAGIDLLARHRFDAIISDIALPDGTGYALINQAHRQGVWVPAIAISGYPFPPAIKEPGATGFQHHLPKPINCDQLCSLLKEGPIGPRDA